MLKADSIVTAFTAEQVVRLTGLTMRQLSYWDQTGFFAPEYADENRKSAYSRMYSFLDVVGLRTLSVLRGVHGVSMPHLRDVAKKLAKYSPAPFAKIKLKVWDRKVHFDEPETGRMREVVDGQYFLFQLVDVITEVKRKVAELRERDPSQIGKFERHRYISHNAEVIAGTRIPVLAVRRFIAAGYSPAAIVAEYPALTEEDVLAVAQSGAPTLAA